MFGIDGTAEPEHNLPGNRPGINPVFNFNSWEAGFGFWRGGNRDLGSRELGAGTRQTRNGTGTGTGNSFFACCLKLTHGGRVLGSGGGGNRGLGSPELGAGTGTAPGR